MILVGKCYRYIDELPVYNWNKIHNTGDYKMLLKERCKIKEDGLKVLKARWQKLYDEYIKHFGFGENFLEILEKEKAIGLMKIEMCETGEGSIQTLIELEEISLQRKRNNVGAGNFHELKSHMSKFLGFQIDEKKMSVMDFYSNLKIMQNERT